MKNDIPYCKDRNDALKYKEKIAEEKRRYDAFSEKDKKQFSREYVERLNRLCKWIADSSYQSTGDIQGSIENEGTIISADELNNEEKIEFTLDISEIDEHTIPDTGITSKEDYMQQSIYDAAQDKQIAKYYDITFSKNGEKISSVHKNTDTTGKLRITMEIPQEYRGHKNYSFVHMHNGEPVTLVDLDDDPDTVTFEVDKFSTFALTYSDVELTEDTEQTTYPASISYNSETGTVSVSSTEPGNLYIATYGDTGLTNVDLYNITVGTSENICTLNSNQIAFVWNKNLTPLCKKFEINN